VTDSREVACPLVDRCLVRCSPTQVLALKKAIKVRGARTHNLAGVDCRFPARKLTVVTGVSGSGKSSLVFDTLYAEGQRRYVQSLSTYARLFLEQMERPDVDSITDIPPAIALEQKNAIKNARSTVGTITEIQDYLRLLMTHAGAASCTDCNAPVASDDVESAAIALGELPEGTRAIFHARISFAGLPPDEVAETLEKQGYRRVVINGDTVELADVEPSVLEQGFIDVVIDRLALRPDRGTRIKEALERGFHLGSGRVSVLLAEQGRTQTFDRAFACRKCGKEARRPTPHLFSFNSPLGACPECEGFGRVTAIDDNKVVPNKKVSLADGAIAPWSTPAFADVQQEFLQAAERRGISIQMPWSRLDKDARDWVYEGDRETPGVRGFFKWLEGRRYKTHIRILLARYRTYLICPQCSGARLRPEALAVRIGKRNIADFSALSIENLARVIPRLDLDATLVERTKSVIREIRNRLGYLNDVGLGYLTLDRQARTLSGGEAQRIHLSTALGSALTDTLYALDEPTVGLHPRDSKSLLGVLRRMTKMGNTVVVVEHDPTLIEGSDHVIDLGPAGGTGGGKIQFEGKPADLKAGASATGRLLLIRTVHRQEKRAQAPSPGQIRILGARENNLDIDEISFPLRRLVCVTGVSGSGKSTLVQQVLYENWLRSSGQGGHDAGACDGIEGFELIDEIMMMSQAAMGRSARSNPATYLKFWDDVRKLFSQTPAARRAKVAPGAFSFNTAGGRCEHCQGTGTVTLEMHFMADIEVRCDDCDGKRFKKEVLEILYKDKNITEVLAMTVDDAAKFFADRSGITAKLAGLRSVGLGYLTLGQATSTLSGGEAQRLKLAGFLAEQTPARRGKLFIFDEPTTGLHLQDVHTLIEVMDALVTRGHSVLVVEHHTDFLSHADHIIDLGPEGGNKGGKVVVAGPPLAIAECPESYTGIELRELLGL
jgi:excinuclease ABC subunit A